MCPNLGRLLSLADSTPRSASPYQQLSPAELLAQSANNISQMQATVTSLAIIVGIVTIIAALIGAVFSVLGLIAQRNAREEIKNFRAEITKEILDRHREHRDNLNQIREITEIKAQATLLEMRQEMLRDVKESVARIDRAEFIERIQDIESLHSRGLHDIEDIMIAFQNECSMNEIDGTKFFDFIRFNTFRHLLIRLISRDRHDMHTALSRISEEYAPNLGRTTAMLLCSLVSELKQGGHFDRPDLLLLAERLIRFITSRHPLGDVVEGIN